MAGEDVENGQQKRAFADRGLFSWIRMNKKYFATAPGIIKIIQLVIGVICLFLTAPAIHSTAQWFVFIVIIGIVVTAIWCFIFFLSAREAISFPINWPLTEMVNMSMIGLMYSIASIFQISHWVGAHHVYRRWNNIIAGMVGILNAIVYFVASFLAYIEWKQTLTIEQN